MCALSTEKKTPQGFTRTQDIHCQKTQDSKSIAEFDKHASQANPFVPHPNLSMRDRLVDEKKMLIYDVNYQVGALGLRTTPLTNPKAREHLMIGGDSNVFGIGVNDTSTLSYRLAQKLKTAQVYNLGLPATGPNALLYFIQHLGIESLLPATQKKGVLVYDFHYYLIERVIGSKDFLEWGLFQARYELQKNGLEYKGPYSHSALAIFYKVLTFFPYHKTLFPNLPKITDDHLLLTAKVLAAVKQEYLKQTNPENRFFVSINPRYINKENKEQLRHFRAILENEKINVIHFEPNDQLELSVFADGHLDSRAHENYAEMLVKKINSK